VAEYAGVHVIVCRRWCTIDLTNMARHVFVFQTLAIWDWTTESELALCTAKLPASLSQQVGTVLLTDWYCE